MKEPIYKFFTLFLNKKVIKRGVFDLNDEHLNIELARFSLFRAFILISDEDYLLIPSEVTSKIPGGNEEELTPDEMLQKDLLFVKKDKGLNTIEFMNDVDSYSNIAMKCDWHFIVVSETPISCPNEFKIQEDLSENIL